MTQEQIKKALKIIEFYANAENWDFEEILDDVEFVEDTQADLGGKRARDFLSEINKGRE